MTLKTIKPLAVLASMIIVGCAHLPVSAGDVPKMTVDQLNERLDDPGMLVLDSRYGRDWTDSTEKIRGAVRGDPKQFDRWATTVPKDKTVVFYCA